MPAQRKPTRARNTGTATRNATRIGAPKPLRTPLRKQAGGTHWKDDCMTNGDPPSLMLWGDDE
jgi:hypothetical protein